MVKKNIVSKIIMPSHLCAAVDSYRQIATETGIDSAIKKCIMMINGIDFDKLNKNYSRNVITKSAHSDRLPVRICF